MKNTKFLYLISVFNLALLVVFLFGFNNAGDKGISIGYNAKIVETDTTIEITYGDTTRFVIDRANHTIMFGSSTVNPTESVEAKYFVGSNGISVFDKVHVNPTVGVTEDLYNEGSTKLAGYATMDSVYARTVVTPLLSATTVTGTTATFNRVDGTDSVKAGSMMSLSYLMRTKTSPAVNKEEAVVYIKGANFIIKYKDAAGNDYYYYFDMSTGATITDLTFSLSEP